ncbi:hypothetical protein OROGR_032232 [Orobanche gracilis]
MLLFLSFGTSTEISNLDSVRTPLWIQILRNVLSLRSCGGKPARTLEASNSNHLASLFRVWMEALYAKLHERFLKLTKAKESKNEKRDHDQEVKLLEFVAAADEMLLYMTSENDELRRQADELKSELVTRRSSSDEKLIHCQKRLTVEEQKNKELCIEMARLQKLEHNQCSHCIAPDETGRNQEKSRDDTSPEETSGKPVRNSKNKKRKSMLTTEGTATTHLVDEGPDRTSDQRVIYGEKNTQHLSAVGIRFSVQVVMPVTLVRVPTACFILLLSVSLA